jgi:putative transposase
MARQNRQSRPRGRQRGEWEELIAKFKRSGLSRQDFCSEASIPVSSFDYWRRKLRRERTAVAPGFVELAPISSRSGWDVEFELGAGVVLRLRRG